MRRPVNTSSLARVRPTTRGRRCVPPALSTIGTAIRVAWRSIMHYAVWVAQTRAAQAGGGTVAAVAAPRMEHWSQGEPQIEKERDADTITQVHHQGNASSAHTDRVLSRP